MELRWSRSTVKVSRRGIRRGMGGVRYWGFRVRVVFPSVHLSTSSLYPLDLCVKGESDKRGKVNNETAMAEQGIVGRGILLDFHSWRLAQDPPIPYDPFKTGSIPLKYLKATAEAQGTEIKFGDILLIRSGEFWHSVQEEAEYRLTNEQDIWRRIMR